MVRHNNKKLSRLFLAIVLLTFFVVGLALFANNQFNSQQVFYPGNGQTSKDPGSGPSADEQKTLEEYRKKCPLQQHLFDVDTSKLDIIDYKCSENEQHKNLVKAIGEEVQVEIYSQNFEEGKKMFRDWLETKGLQESSTLRITYTHKPQE